MSHCITIREQTKGSTIWLKFDKYDSLEDIIRAMFNAGYEVRENVNCDIEFGPRVTWRERLRRMKHEKERMTDDLKGKSFNIDWLSCDIGFGSRVTLRSDMF